MKIIRDGKEYELTDTEMYDAYREEKRAYLIEDILGKAEDMEIEINNSYIDKIADLAERTLEHNDGWYESYWISIEYAIENTIQN